MGKRFTKYASDLCHYCRVCPLKGEGADYAQKLKSAGVEVVYQDFAGMIHGFFSMPKLIKAAKEAQETATMPLKKAFAENLQPSLA
jgi:acetyl esterase